MDLVHFENSGFFAVIFFTQVNPQNIKNTGVKELSLNFIVWLFWYGRNDDWILALGEERLQLGVLSRIVDVCNGLQNKFSLQQVLVDDTKNHD